MPDEAAPAFVAGRLPTLDTLRGLAVMGILLMNVVGFAMPSGAYFNPYATGTPSTADLALWSAAFVLIDGKMRALFSILFGASTLIVVARAEASGADPVRVHAARMGVLALFGIAHWLLLWPGDILLHYAIVGMLALPFTTLEPRQQIRVAVLLLLAQAAVQALILAQDVGLRAAAQMPGAGAATLARWHALAAGVGIGRPADVAREIATHRGPFAGILSANGRELVAGTPFLLVFDGFETLAYMLIGMAALSSGLLAGRWPVARSRTLGLWALAVGLPLSALLCLVAWKSGFDTIATFATATLGGVPLRPLVAIGYAALLVRWAAGDGPLRRRIRAAGRAAFSNYLATSLVMTAIFYGWGLGRFGGLGRAETYLLVPPLWCAMLGWSAPWLARHRYGPLEWIWRRLSRGPIARSLTIENS